MAKDAKDELSELLDSFQNDDTMEKKIEDFARRKEKKSRLDRKLEVDEDIRLHIPNQTETTKIKYETTEEIEPEPSGSKTMVFDKGQIDEDMNSGQHTVIMDNDEIQSLIDENKGPQLIRESDEDNKKTVTLKRKPSAKNKKIIAIVVAGIVGLCLIGGLVYGIINFVQNSILDSKEQTSEQQQKSFDQLKKFIDSLQEDPQGLTAYESTFKKLSNAQKKEINELLKAKTGKTFDELIKQIKSQKEEDSKNNNTQVAEQKAKLKDEIASLQNQLQDAQNELDSVKSQLSQAQSTLNGAISQRDSAQTNLTNAQARYEQSKQQSQAQNQAKKTELENQISQLKDEANELAKNYDSPDDEELQAALNGYNQQIANLQQQISALGSAEGDPNLYNQVLQAQNAYDSANLEVSNAQNQVNSYEQSVNNAQATLDSINDQIAQKQSQLTALK